jgi:WD40 repeat protein/serine/threonine protein kinase
VRSFDDLSDPIVAVLRQPGRPGQASTMVHGLQAPPDDHTFELGPASDPVRQQIGPYEVLEEIGRGGMGVVYRARHVQLGRVVALKMMLGGRFVGDSGRARFRAEAEAAARLQHPHIVQLFDVGEHEGQPYFTLEYVNGGSLRQLVGKPQPPQQAAQLLETLARADHYAHEHGVIHRDLKPANVLLARIEDRGSRIEDRKDNGDFRSSILDPRSSIPKVTDFGLAKLLGEAAELTQTGTVMGTPEYMAPEQTQGKAGKIGPETDVYALGAILYCLLTGRPPLQAESSLETLLLVQNAEPVAVKRLQPGVPRDLETICLKCLRKNPRQRYGTALELADDLRSFLDGLPIRARPVSPAERLVKWARRSPTTAALLSALVLVIAVGFGLVLSQWSRADARAKAEEQAKEKEQQTAASERAARQEVEKLSIGTLLDQGIGLCEKGDLGPGLLTLTDALDLAVKAANADLERVARLNLSAWRQHLSRQRFVCEHPGWVWDASLSPDRKTLLTASTDKTADRWDAATGKRVAEPLVHDLEVWTAVYSPDGLLILTGSGTPDGKQGGATLWDAATGKRLAWLDQLGRVDRVAFSPDGQTFLTVAPRQAQVWTREGKPVTPPLRPLEGIVTAGALSPDGKQVLTGGSDGRARLWDAASGEAVGQPLALGGAITRVAFSPDGATLAAAGSHPIAPVWDAAAGKVQLREQPVGLVGLWERVSGKPIGRPLLHNGEVNALAFSPDSQLLATGSVVRVTDRQEQGLRPAGGEARLWQVATGLPLGRPLLHPHPVWSVALSPGGQLLLTGDENGEARLFSSLTGLPIGNPMVCSGTVRVVAFAEDGRSALTATAGYYARLWDLPPARTLGQLVAGSRQATAVAFSSDGKTLLVGARDGTVRLWDVAGGQPVGTVLQHGSEVKAVAWSPSGEAVLTGGSDGFARLWDRQSGRQLQEFRAPLDVQSVAFLDGGKTVLTACCEGTIQRWDAATGRLLGELLKTRGDIQRLVLSSDGKTAVVCGLRDCVKRWDLEAGRVLQEYPEAGGSRVCSLSADGRTVLTGSFGNRPALLWDVATGRPRGFPLLRGKGDHLAGAFSSDGRLAVMGSVDGLASLWDTSTGRPVSPPLHHAGEVCAADFRPDGRLLALASNEGIRLYEVPEPLAETPEQIRLWLEVNTALERTPEGVLRQLDAPALQQHREQLERAKP